VIQVAQNLRQRPGELEALVDQVLCQEAGAIASLPDQLDPDSLREALDLILGCQGMVMAVGAGTSSAIARRWAHLLTYAGAPATYLDSGQAQHGYSGILTQRDIVVAFSRGGETDAVNDLLSVAKRRGCHVIGVTERMDSTLAQLCDVRLDAGVAPEHEATDVLPLATSLAHAAVGDALCAAVQSVRNLPAQELAELYPGGAVGRRLRADMDAAESRQEPNLAELRALKGLILDMDGALWHGEMPLPGLEEFFDVMRRRGMRFVLATNNPSKRPEEFAEKARRMGVKVDLSQVLNSGMASVHYLQRNFPPGSRVHVVGEVALKEMVAEAGFELAGDDVVAVLVALDRSMTYEIVERATLLIRGGATFIGTNADPFYPTDRGILPGSGTMVATLQASTARTPIIAGKPERWMFDLALERMGLAVDQVASVGDRLDTDIAGGTRIGMKTILVLSGIAQREDLAESTVEPTWVFSGISELARVLDGKG
jgi:4-nitrophenyl phosphatase